MGGNEWEGAYAKGFKITKTGPSVVAEWMLERLPPNSLVADLGCGSGRNAFFLAGKGHTVHAFDVVNLLAVPNELKEKVRYVQTNVAEHDYGGARYGGAILARLIQYLSPRDFSKLMGKLGRAVAPGGVLALNYTLRSGMRERYGVKTFTHDVEEVKKKLRENGFEVLRVEKGASESSGVPFKVSIEAYDILAVKRPATTSEKL